MDIDSTTKLKIEETVTRILKIANLATTTEMVVRNMASENLGIDLSSHITYKKIVRQVIESFLISIEDDTVNFLHFHNCNGHGAVQLDTAEPPREEQNEVKKPDVASLATVKEEIVEDGPLEQYNGHGAVQLNAAEPPREDQNEEKKPDVAPPATTKEDNADRCRVICKLSNRRNVAVRSRGGKTIVSIREFCGKKQVPAVNIGCHLTCEQWSALKNNIPAIENAITEMESKIRSKLQQEETEATDNRADHKTEPVLDKPCQDKLEKQKDPAILCLPGRAGTQAESKPTSTPTKNGVLPVQIIRFDGNNYDQWAPRMELVLNQLKVAYVLNEPCPSPENTHSSTVTAEKWMNDDCICHMNILNSLSDNLFGIHSKKPGSAKDLWEELKLMSLYEQHGAKVSLVKKYLEFQMVDGKPIMEQVHELHRIADSVNAAGMYVEENFHVNVIISKFPPSWRDFGIQLMREEFLPVWVLMHRLKLEEDSRELGIRSEVTANVKPDYSGDSKQHKILERQRPLLSRPKPVLHKHETDKRPRPIQHIHETDKRPRTVQHNPETDRDRKVKQCNYCGKKGHLEEHCWSKKRCLMENNAALEKKNDSENPDGEVKGVEQAKASDMKKD